MRISRRNAAAALGVLAFTFFCGDLSAQAMPSFFKKQSSNRKRTDSPTVVEAATMDIDMENNVATLLGNVVVDDQEVKITCDKMIIHMEDKAESAAEDGGDAKSEDRKEEGADTVAKEDGKPGDGIAESGEKDAGESGKTTAETESAAEEDGDGKEGAAAEEDDPSGGKQLKKIECFGEVVITHRGDPNDSSQKEQVATSDYALYDVAAGTITLTGRPVLTSGTDRLDAEKIVFEVETGRTFITTGKGIYYGDTPVSSGSAGGKKKK